MKKKVYFVRWECGWHLPYSAVVKAKDKEHAWRKVKRQHPFSTERVVSIEEFDY